jgi:response regulator RpfG family c-di-GMP phosphodiesterase
MKGCRFLGARLQFSPVKSRDWHPPFKVDQGLPIDSPRVASRILIAENDTGAREQLSGWLEVAGFACSSTGTSDALAEARRHHPEVAVVGVTQPEDGGMWIVRSLRNQATPPGVVVMSATPSLEVATAATRLGAVECLPWPSSERSIVDAVRKAAEWRSGLSAAFGRDARLREEVEHGREQLRGTLKGVQPEIAQSVLLAVMESRFPDIHDHVQRVAQSSAALARTMRLAPIEIRDVRAAALLHEIGKIALPPRLLSRAGALTDYELSVVQQYVSIGSDVLSDVPTLAPIAPLVAGTQERYDGTGYPAGLSGERIPLGARIITVADTYDALTARRPFGDPMSHDDANAELVRSAGSHLDPDVVRAWMEMVEARR